MIGANSHAIKIQTNSALIPASTKRHIAVVEILLSTSNGVHAINECDNSSLILPALMFLQSKSRFVSLVASVRLVSIHGKMPCC